ncbi:energy transducer TonB [Methyloversatilis universalis]|uniref:energy transducer TonB n=1 Tax=Methyloversatilis universalis TaxID=378211 RepID=UPI0003721BA3|nr:energy transducer TonB [Methyloversatilis universalis]
MTSAALRPDAPEFLASAPALGPAAARLVRRIAVSGIPRTGLTLRGGALVGAVLLHVLALLWIVHAPAPVEAPQIVMHAALIAPEPLPMTAPEPPKEQPRIEPEPPKPLKQPKPQRKETALPVLAAASDAPTAASVAPQPPAPPEPVAIDAAPARPSPPSAAPDSAPAAAPVIPPRFDAAYLQNPAPTYPPMAKRQNQTGRVVLRVSVSAEGLPTNVVVLTSSGYELLDQAALEVVRNRWKFVPAKRGDQAVAGQADVPLSFRLGPGA